MDNILNRLRIGECNDNDLNEINKLVLTNLDCDVPEKTKQRMDYMQ